MMHDRTCPVLVVEDDEDIRNTVVEILEDEGYCALGAEHGGEALAKLGASGTTPCVILLDLMMPVMDGITFRARQLDDPALSTIPVVVMSAYPDVEQKSRELRSAGTLRKPIQFERLLETVSRFCGDERAAT